MPAVETSATVQSRSGFASGVNGMMPGSCRAAHAFITWRLAKSRKRYESMLMVRLAIAGRQPLGGAVATRSGHGDLRRLQTANEREPLELDVVCVQKVEQRLRWLPVKRHEVIVRVVREQLHASFENMGVVLDQAVSIAVCLSNFAFRSVATDEPVVAQRSCVLLLGYPNAFGGLLLEAVE